MRSASTRFFATCARGLEPVLARELTTLHAEDVQSGRGGVAFAGDRSLLYRTNLWLRTAVRVLQPILEAEVASTDELYQAVQSIDWELHLTLEHTFAVDCNVRDSRITHSHFAALRTKDAICDQFIARTGKRPSIDTESPMVKLNLHIYKDRMVLSLDSSGESLHKRGYRGKLVKAPLNEALAAGIILYSGWNGETPLVDPLCGSGTLLIEACWIVLHRPPGLTRRRFGFQGWLDFDVAEWTAIRDAARQQVHKTLPATIQGSDLRPDVIRLANEGARLAGVGHLLDFQVRDIREFRPADGAGSGFLVFNPPYGERLGETADLQALYKTIGQVLRERCQGWSVWIFSGNPLLEEEIKLEPRQRLPLYNGQLDCRLLEYRPS